MPEFDDHARDMAFDQLAVRMSGRQLRSTRRCKVPADPFTHEGLDLGGWHAGDSAKAHARHNSGNGRRVCSHALGSCGCRGHQKGGQP
jgi:hypothetical protein